MIPVSGVLLPFRGGLTPRRMVLTLKPFLPFLPFALLPCFSGCFCVVTHSDLQLQLPVRMPASGQNSRVSAEAAAGPERWAEGWDPGCLWHLEKGVGIDSLTLPLPE